MLALMFTLAVTKYSQSIVFIVIMWILAVAMSFVVIMQQSHYTVDVLIAWYICPLLWVYFKHFVPWDISRNIMFWKDQPIVVYHDAAAGKSPPSVETTRDPWEPSGPVKDGKPQACYNSLLSGAVEDKETQGEEEHLLLHAGHGGQ